MRHVPRVDFIVIKLGDLKRRAEIVTAAIRDAETSPGAESAARKLRSALKWVSRIGCRVSHKPLVFNDGLSLEALIETSFRSVLETLRNADADLFPRRQPFHHFVTSDGEPVVSSLMAASSLIDEAIELVRPHAPGLVEQLHPAGPHSTAP